MPDKMERSLRAAINENQQGRDKLKGSKSNNPAKHVGRRKKRKNKSPKAPRPKRSIGSGY